jgi:hypothetical protein
MPKLGAYYDVCSSDNVLEIYGLNSKNFADNTGFKMGSNHPDDGLLLASRLSYNWAVLGCRRARRGERGACS